MQNISKHNAMKRITLHIADKHSNGILTRSFQLGTVEQVEQSTNEIFAEADKIFSRYTYEAECDEDLTDAEIDILGNNGIEII